MKSWVLHDIGRCTLEEVTAPVPKPGEVLVAVKAAGICGSDIPRIFKTGAHNMPLIPGHEFSGQVATLGDGVNRKWIGKRVGVFPLIPCGKCRPCMERKFEMCKSYSYLGSRRDGAFAQYVAVPKWNLLELPENVAYEEAAMLEPMSVAVHAIRRVTPGIHDTVVVCGLGTIGQLIVMFLVEQGVKNILVIGNKEFQKQSILKLGIKEENYCDSRSTDVDSWIMEHTQGYGANVFFECVGNNTTVRQAVALVAPAGRICMVGNPASDMSFDRDTYWKILRHQLIVTGTWNSTYFGEDSEDCRDDDLHYVLERLQNGSIKPARLISHRYGIDELDEGFHIMRDKTEDYIKIMMSID